MSEFHYQDLLTIGRRIQSREISSEEVTQELINRIEYLDSTLHSYFIVMKKSALAEARIADEEIARGKFRGPLHGVPLAVKDLLWAKGVMTTNGMPLVNQFVPQENSTVVERLRAAGAVLLGKLIQTEGALFEHHSQLTPPTNPWLKQLWSGASSSGSGVATAAGLCYGSIGTDTGGSIRFPSAINGITGIKPTWGRVSRYGAFELAASMDHIGPMARNVADATAILQAIAGRDPKDPTSSTHHVPDYLALMTRGVRNMRIGVDATWALDRVDESTRVALTKTLDHFIELGAEVVDISMPDTVQIAHDWNPMCAIETAVAHEKTFPSMREQYGSGLAELLDLGHNIDALDYQKLRLSRARLRGYINGIFESVDVIFSPVIALADLTHDVMKILGEGDDMACYTSVFNFTGNPAITLPCGRTKLGAPIAYQIIASHFEEVTMIQAGWAYQQVTHWHKLHPQI
ncbi:amidase [Xenorhabdus nematophila]|uniref:Amidase amiD n=1 Tax=Xenorhabdus nematophila (strain ATCC 19061 / DSM 3370 / CCUG 14189 / LMG 1036 / NCIMB 9965 / AN6) TaxID=406817 RepID=D3VJB1_XENNA|nr:amidase [Xenorhabdus nematophila]CEE90410.1 putative amidase amiD [Xenorhabdus nematophila str. Anatoliense]CBJ88667.1 putative amidase amiD [Xenorhabdus nematophila ATCC 19061]CCW31964.1 putative amidase AmiD [Xenorhabdus nematophila F1]CEE93902.1 putative amidase amiD [Xenorhabdus nematophila str. Anatoliense]CEK21582.1 putative amidase amiD [Xenorhabdus nematophila AN6/1]